MYRTGVVCSPLGALGDGVELGAWREPAPLGALPMPSSLSPPWHSTIAPAGGTWTLAVGEGRGVRRGRARYQDPRSSIAQVQASVSIAPSMRSERSHARYRVMPLVSPRAKSDNYLLDAPVKYREFDTGTVPVLSVQW